MRERERERERVRERVNGKPTLRLRRDKEGPREDAYGDLYARHEETKDEKLHVTYNCCIEGFLIVY